MDTQNSNEQGKSFKIAVICGLVTMVCIMFGAYYKSWTKQSFTTGSGVVCEKEPLSDWICNPPPLLVNDELKKSRIDTNSRLKTESLSEQELKQLINDQDFENNREKPKVRAYINFAKDDGKITVNELEQIYKLIDEAKNNQISKSEEIVRGL